MDNSDATRKLKNMVCQNKWCGAIVGSTDGERLFIKGKLVPNEPLAMTYNCFGCRAPVRWESKDYKKLLNYRRK